MIRYLLETIIRKLDASEDRENYIAQRVDFLIRREARPTIRFVWFTRPIGDAFTMPLITATDITTAQTLQFGLLGSTPQGDTFAEPTVVVTPTNAGTVALQPSVQGQSGAFTTAGVFTPAGGFTGPVDLSAEVQGVDDQDATFNVVVVPAPETVAFDATKFVASTSNTFPAPSTGGTSTVTGGATS